MSDIVVNPILLSRPYNGIGLATLYIKVPVYVWTEFLTHKRFARNASSARAQNAKRHVNEGSYIPETFYSDMPGMRVGEPLPEYVQQAAQAVYEEAWSKATGYVETLTSMGVSREQANRLLPTTKMISGIVTGTESAWNAFLYLRNNPNADVAMQKLASKVDTVLRMGTWLPNTIHLPLAENQNESSYVTAGRIARISYKSAKQFSDEENEELGRRLIDDGHMSPFEHIAIYKLNPRRSAICSQPSDICTRLVNVNVYGWENARAFVEQAPQYNEWI